MWFAGVVLRPTSITRPPGTDKRERSRPVLACKGTIAVLRSSCRLKTQSPSNTNTDTDTKRQKPPSPSLPSPYSPSSMKSKPPKYSIIRSHSPSSSSPSVPASPKIRRFSASSASRSSRCRRSRVCQAWWRLCQWRAARALPPELAAPGPLHPPGRRNDAVVKCCGEGRGGCVGAVGMVVVREKGGSWDGRP